MSFSKKIKELRAENGINQRELAKMSGLSPQSISAFENGTNSPTVPSLLAIANAFNVSVDFLLDRTDELGAVVPSEHKLQLSEEEIALLELYRQMSAIERVRFIAYGEGITGVSSSTKKA